VAILVGMQPPLLVRSPTDAERRAMEAGLRSPVAFLLPVKSPWLNPIEPK
jgi:hypothetical protein